MSFGTRHTLSSQTDPKRGIGAALNWAEAEFNRYSAACGNCLTVARTSEMFTGDRASQRRPGSRDMVAIQRGTERPNDVVIIQGHIDSRVTDIMNATSDAPGANDDGSGTAAVIEAARVLSKHKFPGTIVYATLIGRGAGALRRQGAGELRQSSRAGTSSRSSTTTSSATAAVSDGVCDSTHARVLSEGPRSQGQPELDGADA